MLVVKLAWRNIWRQKRRTWLSSGAIAVALLLSVFMRSMQEGSYAHNLLSASKLATGLLQIQHPEYEDSQSLNSLIPEHMDSFPAALSIFGVEAILPRLQSPMLFSSNKLSKAGMLIGFDAQSEREYSALQNRTHSGDYFSDKASLSAYPAIMLGQSFAEYLEVELGDSIVLFGQGRHGNTAAQRFELIGTLDYPNAQLESQLGFIQLTDAQRLLSASDLISSMLVHGNNVKLSQSIKTQLQILLPEFKVMDWRQSSPEMAQQFDLDRISGQLMIGALYVVVGFGLFATIIMMTLERTREFSMLLASGLSRLQLCLMLSLETLFITTLGILFGLALALPLLVYFAANPIPLTGETASMMLDMGFDPILPFSLDMALFTEQILIVVIISGCCICFPLIKACRLNIARGLSEGAQ